MGKQQTVEASPKKKNLLPLPVKTIQAVPKKTERKKSILGARIVAREGGIAPEASISYGPIKLAGGAISFPALDKNYGYGTFSAGFGKAFRHIDLRYKGALTYGALGTKNMITAHHVGTSIKFSIGKAKLRFAAGITPLASYEPVYIESQWGTGASLTFLNRFTPYAMAGGRFSSGKPIHAKTYEYLVPRYENLLVGAQYIFRQKTQKPIKARIEAELTPFYKGGLANISFSGKGWSLGLGAGARKWHDDLFAGKAEPVFKAMFSYDFDFGKRVGAKAQVDVEQTTFETYRGSVDKGIDYQKQSLTDIVAKDVPGRHDSSTFPVFLYADASAIPKEIQDSIFNTRNSLVSFFGNDFLDALSRGYMDDLANASIGLSVREKIVRASFLADMMKNLTYDPDYDAIGRPRDVYGKGPEQFLTDMQEVIHRTSAGREISGWLNPKTSCNEIHATATAYLRKSGVKAFTVSTATAGWNWHVISAAVGDDGLYLIDYGDIYKTKKYDLGLLLQSYAKEKGQAILGSYIFTDKDYLGLYTTPQGELIKGVVGIEHYKEIANMLGVER